MSVAPAPAGEPEAPPAEEPTPSIRTLTTIGEMQEASALLQNVWRGDRDTMPAPVMQALAHSGNYVVGVFKGDRMLGASVAFFEAPARRAMHSHITGVHPDLQGHGIGRALKLHQREWALARDVGHISWTFDPLVARNAHFNLRVLGARVTEYLPNLYGAMDDGINSGDESDRVMVWWALAAPPAPVPAPERVVETVKVPHDIEAVRREAPADAADWRVRVREAFQGHLADGLVVGGFDDALGYLFVRP
jgi:predicted GNAT superfamily acetyltransferase